tara:strand:+ start:510 stop:929 length:420 start_codon:yes stop_codon:yes gene_type:complete
MKKFLGIVVLCMLFYNNSFAKDLTGKIIYCENWKNKSLSNRKSPETWKYTSFEFLSANEVEVISIRRFKLNVETYDYIVEPKKIKMGTESLHYRIDRKNLTLNNDKHCKVVEDENFNPKEIMQKNLQKVIKAQEKLNKI